MQRIQRMLRITPVRRPRPAWHLLWQGLRPTHLGSMESQSLVEAELTRSVIGAFYEVYNTLGFGFLENVYSAALARELETRGHCVAREVKVRVRYKGLELGIQRLDMVVDEKLVLEIKSTYALPLAAERQVYNYLRGCGLRVGLLLHFGPEPRFYRMICSTHRQYPPNPPNPPHPV